MANRKAELGILVRRLRQQAGLTQEGLADALGTVTNRTAIGYLEQGHRIPRPEALEAICSQVGVPREYWEVFTDPQAVLRLDFEELLSELTGVEVGAEAHPRTSRLVVEEQVESLFRRNLSERQTLDLLNSICVFYGLPEITWSFFEYYLGPPAFGSTEAFQRAIARYQKDAIRLFATLKEGFEVLNRGRDLKQLLAPLATRSLQPYHDRTDWDRIEEIAEERLPDLGYISAKRVKQEAAERTVLSEFLRELADEIEAKGPTARERVSPRQQRRIDSLLRKFESTIQHGVGSSLFAPDADELRREADRLAPKTQDELTRMEQTQESALRNLASYLSADYLDVYVATSMRTDADFVSVNRFVQELFDHELIRPLKLRYFNPTQSWVEDRIAKGLVEALMLRRSSLTIYMAQKSDTFGKDSEASVALGQGKPVIVYVPKLWHAEYGVDAEALFRSSRGDLITRLRGLEPEDEEEFIIDDTIDYEAIAGRILNYQLAQMSDRQLIELVMRIWADFDLYGEAERFQESKSLFRSWLDGVVAGERTDVPGELRQALVGTLVASAIRMEARARVFREIHPLALQVILSTGVLNGILVARTSDQCAEVMEALLKNELSLTLEKDDQNYRVVEDKTGSTVRVISRNRLLQNAFDRFYSQHEREAHGDARAGKA